MKLIFNNWDIKNKKKEGNKQGKKEIYHPHTNEHIQIIWGLTLVIGKRKLANQISEMRI